MTHDIEIRALVIEDDSSWQNILNEILSDQGMVVDVVDNLEDAILALRETAYRLAIVDISLHATSHHNQDGLAVLEAIQRYAPGCVAILLTGYATVELAVEAITQYGAFTCLRKERFVRSEFRQILNDALAGPPAYLSKTQSADKERIVPQLKSEIMAEAPSLSSNASVLIVEDDAGWRNVLSELLVEEGFRVQLCSGYGEALGSLGRQPFDLGIVDLSLADRPDNQADGYHLLQYMRATGIPAVVVSGIAKPDDIQRLYREYGVIYCLGKQSFDRQTFFSAIYNALDTPETSKIRESLTDREQQVLDLLITGMTNKEIAATLVISANTVKRHLKSIFRKLDVQTRAAAVAQVFDVHRQILVDRPEHKQDNNEEIPGL